MYKDRFTVAGATGLPDALRVPGHKYPPLSMWGFDERGSLNAVCGLLQKLGVRWYAPAELGEVVPSPKTISLQALDETVLPDFPIRRFNVRFGVHGSNLALWAMRLGLRDPYEVPCAHGMANMNHREEIFERHPDWFALYGGKRQIQKGLVNNHLCYSNQELFEKAQGKVEASGIDGKRLALVDDFLKGLRHKSTQLGRKRVPLPVLRLVGETSDNIQVVGKLGENAWVNAFPFPSATCRLRELQTGRAPIFETTVKTTWRGNHLYIGIRCKAAPSKLALQINRFLRKTAPDGFGAERLIIF